MSMPTRFTQLVGCRVPIQQAPMGSVSTPALALAVADAGGVGSITAMGMSAEQVDATFSALAARTNGVLAANFLTAKIDREAVAVAARRVRIIDFFWVDPDPTLVEIAHTNGALVCWQVGSLDEAKAAAGASGVEALHNLHDDVVGEMMVGSQTSQMWVTASGTSLPTSFRCSTPLASNGQS